MGQNGQNMIPAVPPEAARGSLSSAADKIDGLRQNLLNARNGRQGVSAAMRTEDSAAMLREVNNGLN